MVQLDAITTSVKLAQFIGQIGITGGEFYGALQIPDRSIQVVDLLIGQRQADARHQMLWIAVQDAAEQVDSQLRLVRVKQRFAEQVIRANIVGVFADDVARVR